MKALTLEQVAYACKGQYFGSVKDQESIITSVTTDSRKAVRNSLFIPLKGAKADGHDYIESVVLGGAVCLSERKLSQAEEPYILVESTYQALKDLAQYYLAQLDLPVVGIIGSVGKTSTKEMVASVLEQKYKVLKTDGNFNNEVGLPLTIFRIEEEHEVAVLEMGISEFHEMERLARIANPDYVVMTNIGACHLENLIDLDGVLKAKSEVFDVVKKPLQAVVNGDDEKLRTLENTKAGHPVFFCKDVKSVEQLKAQRVDEQRIFFADEVKSQDAYSISARLHIPEQTIAVTIPIPGEHNVSNALAAAAIAMEFHLTPEQIKNGIESVKTISGRSNLVKVGEITVIDDCYNANPMSMKASLSVLSKMPKRRIAVLGDMGELGKNEHELHYEVGQYASQQQIDALFVCGELSAKIAEGAKDLKVVRSYENLTNLIDELLSYIEPGDTILVKASHFMQYSKVVEAITKAFG
ncbi:UDP-N-acetylmuramoyl-tripeptide--D-alanyl-D-alanine ligase [Eubacterium oxidoreducens]|uniref:UDP-N-acetylmuramoyl-tripeptide--D-alanyl-D-alanine ligase n=1 Tax=Eubacterium oxidoreducens TaxID=1732 RepID=A0A1G6CKN0_EUBOX|nr:UDP-N-acetylmuramoyl-tripeptide--D-alanyl-D-alanine ligase [Eubacterium oxidoreducens]SDB33437.1 UDP-N-acetylmuramoyl-tripeptide--D-alanyl-D-alanine ligase [Eubacterium oxidoreducens]